MEVSVGRLREGREGREEWKEGEREEGKAGGRDGNVTVKRYLVVYTRHPTYIHTTNAHTHTHTHTHTHRCLQQLGRNHGYLVSTLVPELLSTHPFFMGKEPDVDDPACIPLHPHCHCPGFGGLEITDY